MIVHCNAPFMRITKSLENDRDPPCEAVSSTHMNGSAVVHCSPDMVQVPGILAPTSGKANAGVTSLMSTLPSGMVNSPSGTGLKGKMKKCLFLVLRPTDEEASCLCYYNWKIYVPNSYFIHLVLSSPPLYSPCSHWHGDSGYHNCNTKL